MADYWLNTLNITENDIQCILQEKKQSWHWWVAVSRKMDLTEIKSSDFIVNLDTLHFFLPIFIFRTTNALGRRAGLIASLMIKAFWSTRPQSIFWAKPNFLYPMYQMRGSGITIFERRKYMRVVTWAIQADVTWAIRLGRFRLLTA